MVLIPSKKLNGSDGVDTDDIVGISSKQGGSIGRPCQARALWHFVSNIFRAKSVHNNLGFQVPDLNAVVSGSAQPIAVWREAQSIDDFTSIQAVQTLSFVQIPEHRSVILTTRSGKRAIGGDTNSVQISSVSDQVVSKLAVGQVPDLDKLIPPSGNDERNRLRRRESDARDPLGVSFGISRNLELALAQSVPETDASITST